jgi:hypothetical protein
MARPSVPNHKKQTSSDRKPLHWRDSYHSTIQQPTNQPRRQYRKLEKVALDIVDLGRACGNQRYATFFVDQATEKGWVYFSAHKNQFLGSALQPFLEEIVYPSGLTIRKFQSDAEIIYWTRAARNILQQGTTVQYSTPYTKQQNGIVERLVGTVRDTARVLMLAGSPDTSGPVPKRFRPHAIEYAMDLHNAGPTASHPHTTPTQRFSGEKPNFADWRIFYSLGWAHNPIRGDTSWDPKARRCRILGNAPNMKGAQKVALLLPNGAPALGKHLCRYKVTTDGRLPPFTRHTQITGHIDQSIPPTSNTDPAHPPPDSDDDDRPQPTTNDLLSPFPTTHQTTQTRGAFNQRGILPSTNARALPRWPFPPLKSSLRTQPHASHNPRTVRFQLPSQQLHPIQRTTFHATFGDTATRHFTTTSRRPPPAAPPLGGAIPEQPGTSGAAAGADQPTASADPTVDKPEQPSAPTDTTTKPSRPSHRQRPSMRARNATFASRIGTRSNPGLIAALVCEVRRHSARNTGRPMPWTEARIAAEAAVAQARTERASAPEDSSLPNTPRNRAEAMASPEKDKWLEAINNEKSAMATHNTYTAAPLWKGRTVKAKLVFRVTREADNSLKYKARLVAKGYTERYGVDFFTTFAPTVATRSLHILLHLAGSEDLEMRHLDVAGAYLEAPLDTIIHMVLPSDYTGGEPIIVLLNKSIYGLRQSGELWNKRLHGILTDLGFSRSTCDPCVYVSRDATGQPILYLCIYVDDILVIGSSKTAMDNFETAFGTRVTKVKSSEALRYVGISIRRNRATRTITISQGAFIADILQQEGMTGCTAKKTPASAQVNLFTAKRGEHPDIRSVVGKVRYAIDHTRPESLFVGSMLSSAAASPGSAHIAAVKHLMRYFSGTPHQGLTLGGVGPIKLEVWVDANCEDEGDSKGQLGYCWRLNTTSGMAYSRSMHDTHVSLSSAEAELRALREATADVIWAREMLEELGHTQVGPTPCHEDNSAVMDITSTIKISQRTRHLTKIMNFVRSEIEHGIITMIKVASEDNVADIFTKPLPSSLFHTHCDTLTGRLLA